MGRKSNSKQVNKKDGKEKKKRKELWLLVDKLLKLTSVFQAATTATKIFEHHLEIEAILKEVKYLEFPLQTVKSGGSRKENLERYVQWLRDNGAKFDGVEIAEFEGYDLGLKATKHFPEGSLILTVPSKIMMTENDARDSELSPFIKIDPLLQNMPNITLALFLLLEKINPDSFWKPYIDALPESYTTVLYFTPEELAELKPSPVYESALKLCRSIARQYAYVYQKVWGVDHPVMKKLQTIFTYDNYRWAVSTVMTRQNNIRLDDKDVTAFIPLWDMCNHEYGKITTDFTKEADSTESYGECRALRDFHPGEQIFIFYGPRSNADLFLHNGFVYPNNPHDSLSIALGVSASDPLRKDRLALLAKLGLANAKHYTLFAGERPLAAPLLAFIRIFNMDNKQLMKWVAMSMPSDLVSDEPRASAQLDGTPLERKAYSYLLTRCKLIKSAYKETHPHHFRTAPTAPREKVRALHMCENQVLDGTIKYLEEALQGMPAAGADQDN